MEKKKHQWASLSITVTKASLICNCHHDDCHYWKKAREKEQWTGSNKIL